MMTRILALILVLSTLQDSTLVILPGSNLDRYSSLMFLFDESFGCLPATRPGSVTVPRYARMREAASREMEMIRDEIIRQEGREGIDRRHPRI